MRQVSQKNTGITRWYFRSNTEVIGRAGLAQVGQSGGRLSFSGGDACSSTAASSTAIGCVEMQELLGCSAQAERYLSMTVFIYVNTAKQIGDKDHIKVFASVDAAETWFQENDPEGVAFEYDVLE
ncbi:hypothetical protein [Bradyrhizobium sp. CCGUVB14]|uniref:hypothetical protein n=1 Tax=Bradyrhizobium sp. CCGUVB14 TaxID=2949628 RepID=UPI0020B3B094|nr:hypothetical protein [Bradyrhizobium sp. CCGUVB14]MCP3442342.1 hypothetical protein [Bradyrhizobium sp. CCGUVB14]